LLVRINHSVNPLMENAAESDSPDSEEEIIEFQDEDFEFDYDPEIMKREEVQRKINKVHGQLSTFENEFKKKSIQLTPFLSIDIKDKELKSYKQLHYNYIQYYNDNMDHEIADVPIIKSDLESIDVIIASIETYIEAHDKNYVTKVNSHTENKDVTYIEAHDKNYVTKVNSHTENKDDDMDYMDDIIEKIRKL
jgi:hypothetical protein